jgi:hypothetical protein
VFIYGRYKPDVANLMTIQISHYTVRNWFPSISLKVTQTGGEADVNERHAPITFMCQTLTSVNIEKEFTILELGYSIIFPLLSKVGIII